MTDYPAAVSTGASKIAQGGTKALLDYYNNEMTKKERSDVDLWLLKNNHPLLSSFCGSSRARYVKLVVEFGPRVSNEPIKE